MEGGSSTRKEKRGGNSSTSSNSSRSSNNNNNNKQTSTISFSIKSREQDVNLDRHSTFPVESSSSDDEDMDEEEKEKRRLEREERRRKRKIKEKEERERREREERERKEREEKEREKEKEKVAEKMEESTDASGDNDDMYDIFKYGKCCFIGTVKILETGRNNACLCALCMSCMVSKGARAKGWELSIQKFVCMGASKEFPKFCITIKASDSQTHGCDLYEGHKCVS